MQLCSVFTETRAHDDIIVIAAEEEERVYNGLHFGDYYFQLTQ